MPQDTKIYSFINYLYSLADGNNRGALADLRRGLTGQPGTVPAMFPYIAPWVPDEMRNTWQEKVYYLVASLFAYYQAGSYGGARLRTEEGNFGKHSRALKDEGKQSASFEMRFTNLLNAHQEDLSTYLRQIISQMRSNEIAINWHQLLHDLLRWNSESQYIQRQWANSYWKYQTPKDEEIINQEQ